MYTIAYIRYKVGEDFHKTVKEVCDKLGIKESELSRIALVEYLRKLSVLSDKLSKDKD